MVYRIAVGTISNSRHALCKLTVNNHYFLTNRCCFTATQTSTKTFNLVRIVTCVTMSTTTHPTTYNNVQDVALHWDYTTVPTLNEKCIHVSLKPCNNETLVVSKTSSTDPTNVPISSESIDMMTNTNTDCDTNSSDSIPEAVLIYERQLRKAQHAKKTSRSIDESDLHVVFVDEYLVVINKPAGVLTVPGLNHNPSILDLVYKKYGISSGVSDPVHMIVHRLDMDTSGLVVFARSLDIAKQMHTIFRNHNITKYYECLVMGHLRTPNMSQSDMHTDTNTSSGSILTVNDATKLYIDLPIQRDHEHPPFMRISTPQSEIAAMNCVDQLQSHGWKKIIRKAAKSSQSMIEIIEYGMYHSGGNNGSSMDDNHATSNPTESQSLLPYTRLRLEPITGRTHQLRVHWYVNVLWL
jgi:23S rRNA-/tRNA-specific pseudouridylate synthase